MIEVPGLGPNIKAGTIVGEQVLIVFIISRGGYCGGSNSEGKGFTGRIEVTSIAIAVSSGNQIHNTSYDGSSNSSIHTTISSSSQRHLATAGLFLAFTVV